MFVQVWSFLICVAGIILVSEAETCQETAPQLYRAVSRFAWTAFILAIACLITSVSTAIFIYLMRHGHLTTSDAAPQAIERCRIIKQGDDLLQSRLERRAGVINGGADNSGDRGLSHLPAVLK